ncbi:hypothetical protein OIHEL45_03160 [Sulfitobacter indolifex HEL-45]|uniref:Uncharacterized protein n=1 Tax=Sulfitobacter indolifex HEL-45 TaxID=391624 RepID=A0ABM9X8B7_9RHOB|nr:hypothetical protein OIHEL45_03160 [Sulfitobacter indolifex HEL-45]
MLGRKFAFIGTRVCEIVYSKAPIYLRGKFGLNEPLSEFGDAKSVAKLKDVQ